MYLNHKKQTTCKPKLLMVKNRKYTTTNYKKNRLDVTTNYFGFKLLIKTTATTNINNCYNKMKTTLFLPNYTKIEKYGVNFKINMK